jgi:uronate dehydrogenase
LLTGSAGAIGSSLMTLLPGLGWQVRGFDRVAAPDSVLGDITRAADLDGALVGVEAIVHFAGQPTEAPWPVLRGANIDGTLEVFEAARRAGIERVVLASSNHAVGFTPLGRTVPAETPPRPDTLYGVSKVFAEALGRYYVDRYGMRVACLRIGTCSPRPTDERSLSTWLSPGDCARLVDACLRSADLGYAVVWGISRNTRRKWSLDEALALGYVPEDDAETYADQVVTGEEHPWAAVVGGVFTSPGFGIDEVAARA